MKTAESRADLLGYRQMSYFVRPMRVEDIPQVAVTEKECFPTGWSPTPFQRELQSRTAAYLVACRATDPQSARQEATAVPERAATTRRSLLGRLVHGVRGAMSTTPQPIPHSTQRVSGYVGLWFIVDETHITAIGTRESERRRGIGELLLLASLEMAMRRGSRVVTLETRISNLPAQRLYLKYGFEQVGLRKGYYVDNREDALIMTTDNIAALRYQKRLTELTQEHARRWGSSVRWLG